MHVGRRAFLAGLLSCLCACVRTPPPPGNPDGEFRDWLKKDRRFRRFDNREDAWKAFEEDRERQRKAREWKDWKKRMGLRG